MRLLSAGIEALAALPLRGGFPATGLTLHCQEEDQLTKAELIDIVHGVVSIPPTYHVH